MMKPSSSASLYPIKGSGGYPFKMYNTLPIDAPFVFSIVVSNMPITFKFSVSTPCSDHQQVEVCPSMDQSHLDSQL